MSTDLEILQKEIADAEATQSRTEGARDAVKEELLKEFDCETIEAAEALVTKTTTQHETVRTKYTTELASTQAKVEELKSAE